MKFLRFQSVTDHFVLNFIVHILVQKFLKSDQGFPRSNIFSDVTQHENRKKTTEIVFICKK